MPILRSKKPKGPFLQDHSYFKNLYPGRKVPGGLQLPSNLPKPVGSPQEFEARTRLHELFFSEPKKVPEWANPVGFGIAGGLLGRAVISNLVPVVRLGRRLSGEAKAIKEWQALRAARTGAPEVKLPDDYEQKIEDAWNRVEQASRRTGPVTDVIGTATGTAAGAGFGALRNRAAKQEHKLSETPEPNKADLSKYLVPGAATVVGIVAGRELLRGPAQKVLEMMPKYKKLKKEAEELNKAWREHQHEVTLRNHARATELPEYPSDDIRDAVNKARDAFSKHVDRVEDSSATAGSIIGGGLGLGSGLVINKARDKYKDQIAERLMPSLKNLIGRGRDMRINQEDITRLISFKEKSQEETDRMHARAAAGILGGVAGAAGIPGVGVTLPYAALARYQAHQLSKSSDPKQAEAAKGVAKSIDTGAGAGALLGAGLGLGFLHGGRLVIKKFGKAAVEQIKKTASEARAARASTSSPPINDDGFFERMAADSDRRAEQVGEKFAKRADQIAGHPLASAAAAGRGAYSGASIGGALGAIHGGNREKKKHGVALSENFKQYEIALGEILSGK